MDSRRWQAIQAAFDELVDLNETERARRLEALGAADPGLQEALDKLLHADADAAHHLGRIEGALLAPAAAAVADSVVVEHLTAALAGRYAILCQLGRGGMATVYLADDVKHHRRVAVKVLHGHLAAVAGPGRFLREIEIAARLTHPHILPMHDSGEGGGFLYYVMPFVEGESLRARLVREHRLPVQDVVHILHDVADALAYAHEHGVVHRDIKPDNVMLTGRHALVMDFGVAKAVSAGAAGAAADTTAALSIGTPAYMAPEQATADPHVDHRADIYALGVMGYEMLAGRPPFTAATAHAVLAAQITEVPEPVTQRRSGVPPLLAHLVMKCLQKPPADRWQSAGEVLSRLEGLTTPSDTAPVVSGGPRRVEALRRRLVIGAGVAAAIVGVAGMGTLLLRRGSGGDAAAAAPVVVMPFENRTGDGTLDPLGTAAAEWVTQGLTELPFLTVLDTREAETAAGALGATASPAAVRRETGAGVMVEGSYVLQGDSLQFQAQISSTAGGTILESVSGVRALRDQPMVGIERLRQRVLGAFASLHDKEVSTFQTALAGPPAYAAYRAYVEGLDMYMTPSNSWADAARRFLQAAMLDSTFLTPRIWAAQAGVMSGVVDRDAAWAGRADSLIEGLRVLRDRLAPFDRARLDFVVALRAGDLLEAYQAALRLVDASPGSVDARREAAISAQRVRRPREALRRLEELDPQRGLMRGFEPTYWAFVAGAHRMLGQYEDELVAARRAWQLDPSVPLFQYAVMGALAALGRTRELDSAAAVLLPASRERDHMAFGLAGELMAHGHAADARRFARYWSQRAEAPPPPPSEPGAARPWLARDQWLHWRAELALVAGDAETAARRAARLHDPAAYPLLRVRILAAQGKLGAARRRFEEWEGHMMQVYGTLHGLEVQRASVLMSLGDPERALEVLSGGWGRWAVPNWNQIGSGDASADPYLAPLYADPRFQALMKPRG